MELEIKSKTANGFTMQLVDLDPSYSRDDRKAKWSAVEAGLDYIEAYDPTKTYAANWQVVYIDKIYTNPSAINQAEQWNPNHWTFIRNASHEVWDASKSYAIGDYVWHDNSIYRCISPTTAGAEWDEEKWVDAVQSGSFDISARVTQSREIEVTDLNYTKTYLVTINISYTKGDGSSVTKSVTATFHASRDPETTPVVVCKPVSSTSVSIYVDNLDTAYGQSGRTATLTITDRMTQASHTLTPISVPEYAAKTDNINVSGLAFNSIYDISVVFKNSQSVVLSTITGEYYTSRDPSKDISIETEAMGESAFKARVIDLDLAYGRTDRTIKWTIKETDTLRIVKEFSESMGAHLLNSNWLMFLDGEFSTAYTITADITYTANGIESTKTVSGSYTTQADLHSGVVLNVTQLTERSIQLQLTGINPAYYKNNRLVHWSVVNRITGDVFLIRTIPLAAGATSTEAFIVSPLDYSSSYTIQVVIAYQTYGILRRVVRMSYYSTGPNPDIPSGGDSDERRTRIHSVMIGDKHSYFDWFLIPSSRPTIEMPSLKSNSVAISGGNGALDFSDALTKYPVYSDRTGSIEFHVLNDHRKWNEAYSDIADYVHGQKRQLWLEDDPNFFYEGRFTVNKWDSKEYFSSITIDYVLSPYKWALTDSLADASWDLLYSGTSVNPSQTCKDIALTTTKKTITLNKALIGQAPIVPILIVSGATDDVELTFSNPRLGIFKQFILQNGATIDRSIVFYGDEVTFEAKTKTGIATLSIEYRPGRL